MYPYVTLMSLCGDVRLLVGQIPSIVPLFVQTLREYEGEALLGSVAPVDEEMIRIGLVELWTAWDEPDYFPPRQRSYPGILERERRLAFCLGGLVQVASGLAIQKNTEECFQMDAVILSYAVLADERDDFEAFLSRHYKGQEGLCEAFADFVRALFLRSLAESHTLIPDMIDIHYWMDSLIHGMPRLETWITDFANILYPESPLKKPNVSNHKNLYNAQDPSICAVRAIRQGRGLDVNAETFAQDSNCSVYGKALCRCLNAIEQASQAWLEGTLPKQMLLASCFPNE